MGIHDSHDVSNHEHAFALHWSVKNSRYWSIMVALWLDLKFEAHLYSMQIILS
jgi:hypothetical protein